MQTEFEHTDLLTLIRAGHFKGPGEGLAALASAAADGQISLALAGSVLLAGTLPAADFIAGSELLCAIGEYASAERLIVQAADLFPSHVEVRIERARIAQRARQFLKAAEHYRAIRIVEPSMAPLYAAEVECLQAAGLLEDAASLLDEAVRRFQRDLPIAASRAELAAQRGLPVQALQYWAEFRQVFPEFPGGYLSAAKIHRDLGQFDLAESLLIRALEVFPEDSACQSEYAWVAHIKGDLPEAERRWSRVCAAYPDMDVGYICLAQVRIERGRLDDADRNLGDAVARFPGSLKAAEDWGFLAQRRGRWEEAAQRWQLVRQKFPQEVTGFAEGVKALRELGRLAEARHLADTAIGLFPDSQTLLLEVAQLERDELVQLRSVFTGIVAEASDDPADYVGLIQSLIGLQSYEEAAEVAAKAKAKFPDRFDLYGLEAQAAEAAGDLRQAEALWTQTQHLFPRAHEPFQHRHRLLARLGDHKAADTVLRDACDAFPDSSWPLFDRAKAAEDRQNWAEALRLWTQFGEQFNKPDTGRLHDLQVKLLDQEIELAQRPDGDLTGLLNYRAAKRPNGDNDPHTVMMAFESLGGIVTGCEFGAVQRAFGAEPLGLLRWSGMAMHTLIDLLERQFINVGDRDNSAIGYYDHRDRKEYSITDKTFGFVLHTHIFDDQQDEKTVFDQVTRRMKFLTRKLLEDLRDGQKIFLFKNTLRAPNAEEIDRLDTAMQSYGNSLLLVVTSADEQHPGGRLQILRDRLWLGYLDFTGEYGPERAERWLELCSACYRQFNDRSSQAVNQLQTVSR